MICRTACFAQTENDGFSSIFPRLQENQFTKFFRVIAQPKEIPKLDLQNRA